MSLATELAHFGCSVDPTTGAILPPIHLSTTYERDEDLGYSRGNVYSRWGNPTRDNLEQSLAKLEGGDVGLAFSSGMSALTCLLQAVTVASTAVRGGEPGRVGCVLYPSDTYHGVRYAIRTIYGPLGLRHVEVDMSDAAAVEAACAAAAAEGYGAGRPHGVLILHTETPSNPLLRVTDIAACAAAARRHGAILSVDATWLTPVLCQPLRLGAHCVMHSTTKYMGGHTDVLGGVLAFRSPACPSAPAAEDAGPIAAHLTALIDASRTVQRLTGAVAAPFDCFLVLRGMRSLLPRMRMHCEGAMQLARALEAHPAAVAVYYPGLPTHPGHDTAAREQAGATGGLFGGMLSVRVSGGEAGAVAFTNALRLFTRATSLGGTESLVEHRRSVEGALATSPPDLVRVSVGLEDPADLIRDALQALDSVLAGQLRREGGGDGMVQAAAPPS